VNWLRVGGWFRKLFVRRLPTPAVYFEETSLLQALPTYQPLSTPQPPPFRQATGSSPLPGFQSPVSELGLSFGTTQGRDTRNKVRDAFSPSLPITNPRLLAGRTEALKTLIRAVEDLKLHVVIYGERGMGKTSLLQILKQLAESAKYQVVYHSCGEDAHFPDTFRTIAAEIPLLYHEGFDVATADTRRTGSLASLLPASDFNVSQLSDTFARLSNTRVLIMLDEFDRSPSGLFRRNIAQLVKNLSDRSVKVQLVIAGVAGNLSDLVEHIPSIRRNVLGFRIPELQPTEVQQMVSIGEEISGLIFDPKASAQIIRMANGSPYLAALLSQYASFGSLDRGASIVSPEDVVNAAMQIADELRARLSEASGEAVDRALAGGWGATLHTLADRSMHDMGCLDADALQDALADRAFLEIAEKLRGTYGLLITAFEEKPERYRFREEGLGSYLWLRLADHALTAAPQPAEQS
jgi:energy-coupling factor transporter ATP-binding protein EcfA2